METRTEKKRAAILAAAKEIFLKEGFSAASMDNITARAAVSKKTVYQHFSNKMALFNAVLAQHWLSVAMSSQQFSLLDNLDLRVETALTEFARHFLIFLLTPDSEALFRVLIAESQRFPELGQGLLAGKEKLAPFTRQLTEYLQQKVQQGILKIDHIDLAAHQFIGLLKEYHFWPKVLGFACDFKLAAVEATIASSVKLFLAGYKA